MAAIPLGHVQLMDKWPGQVNPNLGIPTGGWAGSAHTGVTAAAYPPGTKIMGYSDATVNPGWYTMYYGVMSGLSTGTVANSKGPTQDVSDGKLWCSHSCMTADDVSNGDQTYTNITYNDGSHAPRYVMMACTTTAGINDVTLGGGLALPCATIAPNEFCFYWIGGVCPVADVTIFQGSSGDATQEAVGADVTVLTTTGPSRHLWADITDSGEMILVGEGTLSTIGSAAGASFDAFGSIAYVDQS